MIDLHIHSTASDGSDAPEIIARKAKALGLSAAAVTDHDNLGGVERFLASCRELGLTGFSGVEISASFEGRTIHLLGYGVDPNYPELRTQFGTVLGGREERNRQIIAKLCELGLPLDWEEVAACAGSDVIARPHIALAMVKRGYVASTQEAFDKYLAVGKRAYCDRVRLTPEENIRLVRAAGGIAVWAHPNQWSGDLAKVECALDALVAMGLGGLECYYSTFTPEINVELLRMAKSRNLVATGGSDYHGTSKPDISIGTGFGHLAIPNSLVGPLCDAIGPSQWVARG